MHEPIQTWLSDALEPFRTSLGKAGRTLQAGLFDAEGRPLLCTAPAMVPGMAVALEAANALCAQGWSQGDAVVTNDADAGAINACELLVVAPAMQAGKLLGHVVVRGLVPDLGGWELAGYSPQAVDRWAEGARIEPVRLMLGGRQRREVFDILQINSRTPQETVARAAVYGAAALALGQAYAQQAAEQELAQPGQAERQRLTQALAAVRPATADRAVQAGWLQQNVGSVQARLAADAGGLRCELQGPQVSAQPVNLGRGTAQRIALAALADALGLQDLHTGVLCQLVALQVPGEGLLQAVLPRPVGLGLHTTGRALYEAVHEAAGGKAEQAASGWNTWLDSVCEHRPEPATGMLAQSERNTVLAQRAGEAA